MGLTEILHNLLHATYGRDVRQSLHDGVKMAVETADETKKAQVELEGKFEAQIKNMTLDSPSDAEIVAARTDASGKTYDTLGKRLDAGDAETEAARTDASGKAYKSLGERLNAEDERTDQIAEVCDSLLALSSRGSKENADNVPLHLADFSDIDSGGIRDVRIIAYKSGGLVYLKVYLKCKLAAYTSSSENAPGNVYMSGNAYVEHINIPKTFVEYCKGRIYNEYNVKFSDVAMFIKKDGTVSHNMAIPVDARLSFRWDKANDAPQLSIYMRNEYAYNNKLVKCDDFTESEKTQYDALMCCGYVPLP